MSADQDRGARRDVGFIGLGGMGSGMACRLLDAGFAVRVHNRTRARAAAAAELGAEVVDSPAEAARGADVVVLSLSDDAAVEAVLFGAGGVLETLAPGARVVDT